jgi:outer membrane receptor protein involved in Fe transport
LYDGGNGVYDPGEPFVDLNGNGQYDGTDQFLDRGYDGRTGVDEGTYYHERSAETWTVDCKITKQLVREHELRTGFQVAFRNLDYAELKNPWIRNDVADGGPWPIYGIDRDFYHHDPVEGAIFLQDVIEYGSLMARVGFRYDFFFQSSTVDNLVESYDAEGRNVIDNRSKLSPRIGISYPISEKAKIYFNYGHFYQLPKYTEMYRRLGFDTGYIGNPNLDFQKTVSYEFGVRYNLSGDYVIDINGFYKDIFGIINTQTVRFGGLELSQYANSDYGRARGFEIQLEKKYGDYISGYVNYTYAFAYGKASSELENYELLVLQKEVPIQEFPLDWDVRHAVQLNFDLRVTKSDHPKLFGYAIPNDWGMNVLWQFFTGMPFTPASGYPGLRLESGERVLKNSQRYPSMSTIDVRFNKNFSFWDVDYSFQIWVDNVFDKENINRVYAETGRPDTHNVVSGVVRGDTEYYQNPRNYDPGRHVQLGLTVHF